jgi:hypothetical protein
MTFLLAWWTCTAFSMLWNLEQAACPLAQICVVSERTCLAPGFSSFFQDFMADNSVTEKTCRLGPFIIEKYLEIIFKCLHKTGKEKETKRLGKAGRIPATDSLGGSQF